MPNLAFHITAAQAAKATVTPTLRFQLQVTNVPVDELIQAIHLSVQIQIQSPQRGYSEREREQLVEVFGPPEAWGQTLRNRLWTQCHATVGPFRGRTEETLAVVCTPDLNGPAARYFHALEEGEVPLLFLFSGSIFYQAAGQLQVSPVSWNADCAYRLPANTWHALMRQHYADTSWLALRRDLFERLYAHKRKHSFLTWEETLDQLLKASVETSANTPRETLAA